MPAADAPIRLRRTNPVDGHKDGKLHCLNEADWWAEIDGVVFILENRGGVCPVTPDLDLLRRLADKNLTHGAQWQEHHKAVMAWLGSAEYNAAAAICCTLRKARAELAAIATGPDWPAARDAYRALLAWAFNKCPGTGRRAGAGTGRPVCPVCHRGTGIGLPEGFTARTLQPDNRPTVPPHSTYGTTGPRFQFHPATDDRPATIDAWTGDDRRLCRIPLTPRAAADDATPVTPPRADRGDGVMSRLRDHMSSPATTRLCPDSDGCARLFHPSLEAGLGPGDSCECCGAEIGNTPRTPSAREWRAAAPEIQLADDAAALYGINAARPPTSTLVLAGWQVEYADGGSHLLQPGDRYGWRTDQPTRIRPLFAPIPPKDES